jgi:3-hydroxybutyryl-CoA dehydrogenase
MNADASNPRIAVVGAGRMGLGISLSFAFSGYPVRLVDSEERDAGAFAGLSRSLRENIGTELGFLQRLQLIDGRQGKDIGARIEIVARAAAQEPLRAVDYVFEAVAEVLEIKQSTYAWLNTVVADAAIIGSTTSTMLVDTLAEFVEHKQRFLNTHWLNPALLMPLVEMSPGQHSSDEAVAAMKALPEGIGKQQVLCSASPESRLWRALRGTRPAGIHRLGWRRYSLLRHPIPGRGAG